MKNLSHYLKYRAGLASAITQTTQAEREALREYAADKHVLAEIGVFHGVNTLNLREVMAPHGNIIAIDPFSRSFFGIRGYGWARRIAHREVNRTKRGTVVWIEDTGQNAPNHIEVQLLLPVDFLFIDGDHSYEGLKVDWESWSQHVVEGGIICLHDSANRGNCGSEEFTNKVILNDSRFRLLKVVDSLTILLKLW